MINRILIRIKVVQLLYSYLLTARQFSIESQPDSPTKERRFAYELYLDMLVLMIKMAERITKANGDHPLSQTRFIKALKSDEIVASRLKKYDFEPFSFGPIINELAESLKESGLYKTFLKRYDAGDIDDLVWGDIFSIVIMSNSLVNETIRKRENYTLGAVEKMRELMTNALSNFYTYGDNLSDIQSTLDFSMKKARDLYMSLLFLPIELTWLREQQIDANRHKYFPTEEDKNPNTRFIDNKLVEELRKNEVLKEYIEKGKISWNMEDRRFTDRLLKDILESDIYKNYMEGKEPNLKDDIDLWYNLFSEVIFPSEDFLEFLEEKSVFWNDDLEIIGSFVLKTLLRFNDNKPEGEPVLPMYKDKEDEEFGKILLTDVIKNKPKYMEYIDEFIVEEKWDSERLPFMDVVITMTAIAEIINFPKIPLTVTYNEYIEIAKSYSTSKSGAFINGVLRSIIEKLKKDYPGLNK